LKDSLPRIDEHATEVDASRVAAWSALEASVPKLAGGRRGTAFARLLGCRHLDTTAAAPIGVGATIPGFRVSETQPPSLLALEGEHRFARYALTFHLDELGSDRTRLRAETHAEFPGPHGKVYRGLVIGTRGHVVAVRRILRAVKLRAERPS
jgi:hypothetical protein